MAATLLFLPPSFPGCRWAPGAGSGPSAGPCPKDPRGTALRARGWWRRPFRGSRAWGRRAPGLPRSPPWGEAARRAPFRAPPAARAVAAAARQAGGGREAAGPGGGEAASRVPSRCLCGRPWPGGLDYQRSWLRPRATIGGRGVARGHEASPHRPAAGVFPSSSRAGASSKGPRGWSGLRRGSAPPEARS